MLLAVRLLGNRREVVGPSNRFNDEHEGQNQNHFMPSSQKGKRPSASLTRLGLIWHTPPCGEVPKGAPGGTGGGQGIGASVLQSKSDMVIKAAEGRSVQF